MYKLNKLTQCKWLNLFELIYKNKSGSEHSWFLCSRKYSPVQNASQSDAVVIVPILKTEEGNRLVVTREFRVPIWDYEYGFPAGLIDNNEKIKDAVRRELKEETGLELLSIHHSSMPVYSSAGMSDESCNMVLAEVAGTVSSEWLEEHEEIEVVLMDVSDIQNLLKSNKKIAAKAWGLFYHFARTGKIEF